MDNQIEKQPKTSNTTLILIIVLIIAALIVGGIWWYLNNETEIPEPYHDNPYYCEQDSDCVIQIGCCTDESVNIYHYQPPPDVCPLVDCGEARGTILDVKCLDNRCEIITQPSSSNTNTNTNLNTNSRSNQNLNTNTSTTYQDSTCSQHSDCVLASTGDLPCAPCDYWEEDYTCVTPEEAEEIEQKNINTVFLCPLCYIPEYLFYCKCDNSVCVKTAECNTDSDCVTDVRTGGEYVCEKDLCTFNPSS